MIFGNSCGFGGGDSWIWVLIIFFLLICCGDNDNNCCNNNRCDECC